MKVKLYKGPFSGKVVANPVGDMIKMRGEKKMSRRQKYEYQMQTVNHMQPPGYVRYPMVEATYKRAMRVVQTTNSQVQMVPCVHPDGSEFYEYVEGSKREYPAF